MDRRIMIAVCLLLSVTAGAQQHSWKMVSMDGSRTGCTAPGADNVTESLGTVVGKNYNAPNGRTYKGGATPRVAKYLIDAQPAMSDLKQVVGYSEHGMSSRGADSPLANFACDALIAASEKTFGIKADFAVLNSGGIRASVPQGKVLKDDIMSIFPFKNYFVLVEYPGSVLISYLERQAGRSVSPIAGVEMVIKDRKLVSATVGGKPIDPNGKYYLATIDFLLGSGDNMRLASGATNIMRTQTLVFDVIMEQINAWTAAGRTLDCEPDGRVKYLR